ncbi:MAG: phosphorylase [Deltaproteobacteria bacterium]|nr:phosphorylase [Deltaproteobacteria bacterium]
MTSKTTPLEPGELWSLVRSRTAHALECGAQQSIPTTGQVIAEQGVDFSVRIVASLDRKRAARDVSEIGARAPKGSPNPFLPHDPDLFVTDLSPTHLCLLNKFNVVDHHLLIVTRAFEDQETLLTLADFEAMWTCMSDRSWLAFYNSGQIAGASQPHKHLQLVPLPLADRGPAVPIEPLLPELAAGTVAVAPALPFAHALVRLDPRDPQPAEAAATTLRHYRALLAAVELATEPSPSEGARLPPYNLLVTDRWMLLVPRAEEFFHTISVNALGFAGALLARNDQELSVLQSHGPMAILKHVAVAPAR